MCIYAYVCKHTHAYTHGYMPLNACKCVYVFVCMYMCMCVCQHTATTKRCDIERGQHFYEHPLKTPLRYTDTHSSAAPCCVCVCVCVCFCVCM